MSRAFTYTTREVERMLRDNGYEHVRSSGSHKIFSNGMQTVALNPKVNKMVALKIIKQCKLEKGKKRR